MEFAFSLELWREALSLALILALVFVSWVIGQTAHFRARYIELVYFIWALLMFVAMFPIAMLCESRVVVFLMALLFLGCLLKTHPFENISRRRTALF